ncbi:multiprotein-bridging factor 1 family protein [Acidobacteriota bacterium]
MGLTQEEVSERLGVDPTTVGCWENDKMKPSKPNVKRLQKFLDKTSNYDLTQGICRKLLTLR